MAGLLRNGRIPVKPSRLLSPLQSVGANKTIAMSTFYSPHYVFALSSNRYNSEADTLAKEWAERRYNTRSEPFWWTCITKKETLTSKKTLRSWIARRTRMAFVESLRKRGYDSDGTRLDPTDGGKALYGTAQLLVREPCLLMKTEDVRKETDLALETIFQRMKKLEGKQKDGQVAKAPKASYDGRTSTLRQGSQRRNEISKTSAPTQSQKQWSEGRGSQRKYEISKTLASTKSQKQWSEGKGIIRKTSARVQNEEQGIVRRTTERVRILEPGADTIKTPPRNRSPKGS